MCQCECACQGLAIAGVFFKNVRVCHCDIVLQLLMSGVFVCVSFSVRVRVWQSLV